MDDFHQDIIVRATSSRSKQAAMQEEGAQRQDRIGTGTKSSCLWEEDFPCFLEQTWLPSRPRCAGLPSAIPVLATWYICS